MKVKVESVRFPFNTIANLTLANRVNGVNTILGGVKLLADDTQDCGGFAHMSRCLVFCFLRFLFFLMTLLTGIFVGFLETLLAD